MKVGIDVEMLVDDPDYKGIAKSFFSKKEMNFIDQFDNKELSKAFLKIWTAKEAFIKANRIIEPNQFTIDFSHFPNQIKPIEFDRKIWYLNSPVLSEEFTLTFSSDKQIDSFCVTTLNVIDLIN